MKKRIVICGGGAAGFFSAINTAVRNPSYSITILEKSTGVLSKVKISGGGRCNVTNGREHPSELVKFYPRGGKKLYKTFQEFSTADMISWLADRQVRTHTEEDLRVFPESNSSETIIKCFMREISHRGINLIRQEGLKNLVQSETGWSVYTTKGRMLEADAVVIATGSTPSVWNLLKSMGIQVAPPVPSLFTFNSHTGLLKELQGISFENVAVRVAGTKLEAIGPMLITHWGLSGPAILKLSAWGARELEKMNYKFRLILNVAPSENFESCKILLQQYARIHGQRKVIRYPLFNLPRRFWERMCSEAGITDNTLFGDMGNRLFNRLSHFLTQAEIDVHGKSTFKEEFVTCGGVELQEINLSTFESLKFRDLYFTGEVLNIDALTGGFNFQACWSSAWAISKAL